jgi:hypothetical protein
MQDSQANLTKTTPKKRKDQVLLQDPQTNLAETVWHLPKTMAQEGKDWKIGLGTTHLSYLTHLSKPT